MKTASVKEIKKELEQSSHKELIQLCLRLSKFKKENKELLNYLLFESFDDSTYLEQVKLELEEEFQNINTSSYYYINKSCRKILRTTKKYIRYTQKKEIEVELLIFFCTKMKEISPSITKSSGLKNFYIRQFDAIIKLLPKLHEDLQYDFEQELQKIEL